MDASNYSVFEYLYRDAGNFKAYGAVLLEGVLSTAEVGSLRSHFESGEYFIAEQIGVPTLYQQLWDECGCEPSDEMDHVWHEFDTIRPATPEDMASMPRWGGAADLKNQIVGIQQWDESLSGNWQRMCGW